MKRIKPASGAMAVSTVSGSVTTPADLTARLNAQIAEAVANAEPRDRDRLPRARLRPQGGAVAALRNGYADKLADLYDPDVITKSFYRPMAECNWRWNVPIKHRGQWAQNVAPHRLQLVECDAHGRPKMRQLMVRSTKDLSDLSETQPYRRAKWMEATGEWLPRVTDRDWKRLCRESFEFGDGDASGQLATGETEFIPIMGGPYFRQLYLYDHWAEIAKAFYEKNHNDLAKAAIDINTNFTLGQGLTWKIRNRAVRDIWEEFWKRNGMDWRLPQMDGDICWQGELLVHQYEVLKGFVEIRSMDPSIFYEIVTDPKDIESIYFYHASFPCLHGDTRIAMLDGSHPTVRELAERPTMDDWTYSYDGDSQRIVPGHISKAWRVGPKRCVRVTIDNGESVICSYDHPFLLRDGTYREAEQLKPKDSLMPLYRRISYEEVWQPASGWEFTHHMVAGGKAPEGTIIHHDNHIKTDNRPDNLRVMGRLAHMAHHRRIARFTKTMPDSVLRGRRTPEQRARHSAAKTRWWGENGDVKRAAMAERAREQWKNPAIREARVNALKASSHDRAVLEQNAAKAAIVRNHKVVSIEHVGEHEVYDIQVDHFHNFALSCGVFTHNTQYQLPYTQFKGRTLPNIPIQQYVIEQFAPSEIFHIKNNVSSSEKWGRSDFYASLGTLKRHRDWTNATTFKSLLQANLVYRFTLHGDNQDIQAFVSDPQNAKLPEPGGAFIQNDALTLDMLHEDVDQSGGRMGRGSVGDFLTALFAAGQNHPVTFYNIVQGGAARANALVQGEPFAKKIARRQQVDQRLLDHLFLEVKTKAVAAGRLDASLIGQEAEWIFPRIYEEDRGAMFRDLTTAIGVGTISHRTMGIQMGKELDLDKYDYDDEQAQIQQERRQGIGVGMMSAQPAVYPTNPIPPAGTTPSADVQGRNEGINGADAKANFKAQQQNRPSVESAPLREALSRTDTWFLEAVRKTGVTGTVRLPSGKEVLA